MNELGKLLTYIEENLRAGRKTKVAYHDPVGWGDRISNKQNHVVFGRRGAGKTLLTSTLSKRNGDDELSIYVNLEDYKDISFPNVLVKVLILLLQGVYDSRRKRWPFFFWLPWRSNRLKPLRTHITELEVLYREPDVDEFTQKTTARSAIKDGVKASVKGVGVELGDEESKQTETSRTHISNKLEFLKKSLGDYKASIDSASDCLNLDAIFLVLDDLYFILKRVQPDLLDYLHRVCKDTDLFLKVATIRHRSKLYRQGVGSYIGMELCHDIIAVDLDYTLDRFQQLQTFMRKLLEDAKDKSEANLDVDDLFSGGGFTQLCLASGGVPRDFLSLFVALGTRMTAGDITRIGKVDVTDAAIGGVKAKMESFHTDSDTDREQLEHYLRKIQDEVYSKKRTNAFLVAYPELQEFPHQAQALRELTDLRLIHLAETNTSAAPSDGRRYEAYILDVGLYENSRPRNFDQIEPGSADSRARKDTLRSAPRLKLEDLDKQIKHEGVQLELELPEETG